MKWCELKTSSAPLSRSSHGVSIIGDKLFLFGGEHEARTPVDNDVQVLELTTGQWSKLVTSGSAPSPRFGHGQCVVGQCVYVFGGRQGTAIDEKLLNDLYKLDTVTGVWTEVSTSGHTPCPRSYHSMLAHGHCLYVFGGCPDQGRLADLYQYDTLTQTWSQLKSGPMEGRGGTPLAVVNGHIFVVGGFAGREMADIHSYNIQDNSWTTHDKTLAKAVSVAVLLEARGRLVLVGGELEPSARGHAGAGNFSDQATIISLHDGQAVVGDSYQGPTSRGWTSGAVWRSQDKDKIVVVGGLTGDDENPVRLGDVWIGEMNN